MSSKAPLGLRKALRVLVCVFLRDRVFVTDEGGLSQLGLSTNAYCAGEDQGHTIRRDAVRLCSSAPCTSFSVQRDAYFICVGNAISSTPQTLERPHSSVCADV